MHAITAVLIIALLLGLAYTRARNPYWLVLPGIFLTFLTWQNHLWGFWEPTLWVAYLTVALLYFSTDLRRRWISSPLLRQFRKVVPNMSQTEREALEAGTVWWDGDLFSGRPNWDKLLTFPSARLSPEEQAFMDGPVQELADMLDDWKITHDDMDLPEETWRFIKEKKFFGMIIPKRYGGLEFSALAHSEVVTTLATRSVTAAVTVMVPNSLGPAKLLLHYGTKEQKDHYLPRLARGDEVPCFALTGPKAGSDAGAIPDRGEICYDLFEGKRTLGIRLNWDKRYITLGPVATVLGLAFKLYDPDHLLGNEEYLGVTLALIPVDTPGVEIGKRHFPLNIPFQNGPNWGKDVFVPMDWVIGGKERIGQGWRMLMENLAEGRGISLPSLAVGAGKAACRYTGAYARVRRQFNQPIGFFEGIEEPLGRIAGKTYQMDSARRLTLAALDCGEKPSVISAIVKYHLTERYRQAINDAMDIEGGRGISLGPRNLIGRAYQAIPISVTVEGANILTRSMIIFGQGAIRCHPFLLKEFQAVQDQDDETALAGFDRAFFGHLGFLLSNLARTSLLGFTRGRLSYSPVKGPTARYFRHLNWMSAAFALYADVAMMTLGGTLKRKERLSARLGDLLSQLYMASAVLKRFHDDGAQASDLPLIQWACEDGLYAMQEALRGLLRNMPFRPLAWLLRWLIFPTGMPYCEPSDGAGKAAARILLEPSACRDRLTHGVYLSENPDEFVAQLEMAFSKAVAAEPLERTLRKAVHSGRIEAETRDAQIQAAVSLDLFSRNEADLLMEADALRDRVIEVDAFDSLHRPVRVPAKTSKPAAGEESVDPVDAA